MKPSDAQEVGRRGRRPLRRRVVTARVPFSAGVHRLPVVHLLHRHRTDVQRALQDHTRSAVIGDTVRERGFGPCSCPRRSATETLAVQSVASATLGTFSYLTVMHCPPVELHCSPLVSWGALSTSDPCRCLGRGCTAGLEWGVRDPSKVPARFQGPLYASSPCSSGPQLMDRGGSLSSGRSATLHWTGHSPVGLFSWLPCEPLGTPKAGRVPHSTTDASGQMTPCRGGCPPAPCGMLAHPLYATGTPRPQCDNQNCLQTLLDVPWGKGTKLSPFENRCRRGSVRFRAGLPNGWRFGVVARHCLRRRQRLSVPP